MKRNSKNLLKSKIVNSLTRRSSPTGSGKGLKILSVRVRISPALIGLIRRMIMAYLELIQYFSKFRQGEMSKLELGFAIALWQESIRDFTKE